MTNSPTPPAQPMTAEARMFWEALNVGIPGPYLPFEQLPEQQRAMLAASATFFRQTWEAERAALLRRIAELEGRQ